MAKSETSRFLWKPGDISVVRPVDDATEDQRDDDDDSTSRSERLRKVRERVEAVRNDSD